MPQVAEHVGRLILGGVMTKQGEPVAQVHEPEGITTVCDLCGWCRADCQVIELSRSHQKVALCSHCRDDLSRMFGGAPH